MLNRQESFPCFLSSESQSEKSTASLDQLMVLCASKEGVNANAIGPHLSGVGCYLILLLPTQSTAALGIQGADMILFLIVHGGLKPESLPTC